MTGSIGILSVGAGDIRLTFDKNNPAECIRSARVVEDMLKRGYALLIEVDNRKGGKSFQRVKAFRADICSYIIADLDTTIAARADAQETERRGEEQEIKAEAGNAAGAAAGNPSPTSKRGGRSPKAVDRAVPASGTRGVAIARSAGG